MKTPNLLSQPPSEWRTPRITTPWLSGLTLAVALLQSHQTSGITFTNFPAPMLTFNGSAAAISNGTVIRVTPSLPNQAGSVFLPVALPTDLTFSTAFQFRLSNAGGIGGADGIAFVLQAAGATASGGSGGLMGYGGITPSLDIEFDSHNDSNHFGLPGDINGTHVAFNTNGTLNDLFTFPVVPALNNSNIWYAWVDYTGGSGLLELRLASVPTRPTIATLSQTNFALAALLGSRNLFAGFTGGTGAGCNDQDLLAWQFSTPQPFLSQRITNFPAIGDQATTNTITLSAAASSALPVSFSVAAGPALITASNTLTFTGSGLVSVQATQTGDADWQPAPPLTNTFQVKNNQTISFGPIGDQVITNLLTLHAIASSGLPVTFTLLSGPAILSGGTSLRFTNWGLVSVVASQAGDASNWSAPPVTNTFRVFALYTLTVVSPFGTTDPAAGDHLYVEGTVLTPHGIAPPTVADGIVTQYLCVGWTMTGNTPFSGNRGNFTMTVTNNARLTWAFTTNVYFHDSFESGSGNWIRNGTWGLDNANSVSPSHAATANPGAYYTNNSDTVMAMAQALSLAGMTHPVLHFWSKYDLENGYDFIYVEGSTNGGAMWFPLPGGTFTGTEPVWTEQQLDLSAWGATTQFQVRFHLVTDASVVKAGWEMDDIHVGNAPAPLAAQPAASTANSVTLQWTASDIGDFAAYRIYRSMTPGQPWQTGLLIGTTTGQDATTFVDETVAPKTHYYYQIVVVNVAQLFAFSPVIPAITAIGMDYPFVDNGEGGGGAWAADAPWALTAADAVSPTHSWEDAPGGNYPNGIAGQSLTLSSPMSFLAAVNPVLTFAHKYALDSISYVNVEASTNHGADWALLASFGGNSGGWIRGRLALTRYAGQAAVLVRFRLTAGPGNGADDWHIDDISVTEGLNTVNPLTFDQILEHSLRLAWPTNSQPAFDHYAIFRDTNATVGINSLLAGQVTNQTTPLFTDGGLSPNTTYYYRVYAVNAYGGYSLDAVAAATTNTTMLIEPFTDDFEAASLINFMTTGNWGLTSATSHSGTRSLTDDPGGNYTPNADDGAFTQLDLRTSQWPVLRFWDHYSISGNARAAVQVGGTSMYVVSGTQTAWEPQAIDLSWWAGQSGVPVEFRLRRWNNEQAGGWFLDDVSVTEQVPVPMTYPFSDNFEHGVGNWLAGTWHVVTGAPQEGTNSVYDIVTDNANVAYQEPMLALAGWIDLTNAVNPQLVFWWHPD